MKMRKLQSFLMLATIITVVKIPTIMVFKTMNHYLETQLKWFWKRIGDL